METERQHIDRQDVSNDATLPTEPRATIEGSDISSEANSAERRSMELREEELIARKKVVPAGTVRIRREVEAVPAHLEVEALRDEVQLEREPIGQEVSERAEPWEEDGVTVIPIYEEQLVVVKRLVLKEHVRVRHVRRNETRLVEDTVLRERLVVDDPDETGQVREIYPTDREPEEEKPGGNLLERAMRKALD